MTAERPPLRVLVRTDASALIGSGHLMRCLTLAEALRGHGAEVRFACALLPEALAGRVVEAGHLLLALEPADSEPADAGWENRPAASEQQQVDAARALTALGGWVPDWIIVDHYRLDHSWEGALRAALDARLLAIDDLANRPHQCAILLDQTFGREAGDYAALTPPECQVLAGARYALLRPEFTAARAGSLTRRRRTGRVGRLLVSLGGTDIGGLTEHVVKALLENNCAAAIDAVVGAEAHSLPGLRVLARSTPRLRVHVDSRDMATLLSRADLAVGAGGTSSWERCCLGVPSVILAVAENQQLIARNLSGIGAAVAVKQWQDIAPAVSRLSADPQARARLTAAAAAVTDGQGASNVADLLLGSCNPSLRLAKVRPVEPADMEALWLWRNDPLTRATAKTREPVPWQDHEAWFERTVSDNSTLLLIGETEQGAAGSIRFDRLSETDFLVSITVARAMRGRGLGEALLAEGCRIFAGKQPTATLHAEIFHDNLASRKIFSACGFEPADSAAATGLLRFVRQPARA